jgi:hypothetical protein
MSAPEKAARSRTSIVRSCLNAQDMANIPRAGASVPVQTKCRAIRAKCLLGCSSYATSGLSSKIKHLAI